MVVATVVGYLVAIPVAFVLQWVACLLYVLVAIMWLIPDRRIERKMSRKTNAYRDADSAS